MVFWKEKNRYMRQAQDHIADMHARYENETVESIRNSVVYKNDDNIRPSNAVSNTTPQIIVADMDSVSGAVKYHVGKTCILNFASYVAPGGGFINGAWAQEEALCHESNLYNILKEHESYYMWNRNNLNNHLYTNRAIYSPDVIFEHEGKKHVFDVITCAAPKLAEAYRSDEVSAEDNTEALRSRIQFIFDILAQQEVEVVILGAWGCGVFKQDSHEVAALFEEFIENGANTTERVVFAVPQGPNLVAFYDTFNC